MSIIAITTVWMWGPAAYQKTIEDPSRIVFEQCSIRAIHLVLRICLIHSGSLVLVGWAKSQVPPQTTAVKQAHLVKGKTWWGEARPRHLKAKEQQKVPADKGRDNKVWPTLHLVSRSGDRSQNWWKAHARNCQGQCLGLQAGRECRGNAPSHAWTCFKLVGVWSAATACLTATTTKARKAGDCTSSCLLAWGNRLLEWLQEGQRTSALALVKGGNSSEWLGREVASKPAARLLLVLCRNILDVKSN